MLTYNPLSLIMYSLTVLCTIQSTLSDLNRHLSKTDTSITQTTGVGSCTLFFSHFTVTELFIRWTPL